MKIFSTISVLSLISTPLLASKLDPVIYSVKNESSSSMLASSHYVLNQKQIEQFHSNDVLELLKTIPGIYVAQTGGAGSQVSISVRGSESSQVLVLIDGIKVNDSSESSRKFNMPSLSSLDIERIEVLKGAQSVQFGSNAQGGVISIITKKSTKHGGKVKLNLGAQKGISNSISVYKDSSVLYLDAFYNEEQEVSAQEVGSEKDLSLNKGATLNYSKVFSSFEMNWKLKVLDSFAETDGFGKDDLGAYNKSVQQIYSQQISKSFGDDSLIYNLSLNKNDRYNKYDYSGYKIDNYSGQMITNEFIYKLEGKKIKSTFGLASEIETFEKTSISEKKASMASAYSLFYIPMNDKFASIGLRNDTHEEFGNHLTYSFGLGKNFEGRKQIKLHYATGFKAPTLYQLYVEQDGFYKPGNENLHPETSRSIDLTFRKMGRQVYYEATIFDTHTDDKISGDSNNDYKNINSGSERVYGIETVVGHNMNYFTFENSLSLYKFDLSDNKRALKRPAQKVNIKAGYKISDTSSLNIDWSWISSRFDFGEKHMAAYDITNISYTKSLSEWGIKVGVKNLFDRDYVESVGYSTYGFTGYFDLSMKY